MFSTSVISITERQPAGIDFLQDCLGVPLIATQWAASMGPTAEFELT
jgi:hypothetical protein